MALFGLALVEFRSFYQFNIVFSCSIVINSSCDTNLELAARHGITITDCMYKIIPNRKLTSCDELR